MKSFFLKLLLSTVLLTLALQQIEWPSLQSSFSKQQPVFVAAALMCIVLQIICGGLRWHHIIRAMSQTNHPHAARTALIYYASTVFNVLIPSTLGSDAARAWLIKKRNGSLIESVYSVVVDRLMSLIGLAMLVASTLGVLMVYLGMKQEYGFAIGILSWIALVAGYLLMSRMLRVFSRLQKPKFLVGLITALSHVTGRHLELCASLCWSIAAHMAYACAAYALARGMQLDLSLTACLTLVPLVLFISTLPISLGGWGIREASMAAILTLVGTDQSAAIALSVQLGLTATLASAGGGLVYLALRK